MKKLLILFLSFIILLGLCACSDVDTQSTDPSNSIQDTLGKSETTPDNTNETVSPTDSTPLPTTEPNTVATTTPTTPVTPPPASEPPHTHNYSSATCTTPKICSCGATEGTANGHNWKDATYAAPKTCSVCGVTEGNPLDVPNKENYHGHVYTGGESSKKYHYEAACAGKNSHEITWEEVQRRNLGPCGTCVLK